MQSPRHREHRHGGVSMHVSVSLHLQGLGAGGSILRSLGSQGRGWGVSLPTLFLGHVAGLGVGWILSLPQM